jgi:hypothetical protein
MVLVFDDLLIVIILYFSAGASSASSKDKNTVMIRAMILWTKIDDFLDFNKECKNQSRVCLYNIKFEYGLYGRSYKE